MTRNFSNDDVIQVESLNAWYGDRHILKNINFSVKKGEIMVVMGGSGSGKSTLLRFLLGLNTPVSGHIRLLGKDITAMSNRELHDIRKNMGVSFQGGALFSSMTLGENIQLPLREHTQLNESTMRSKSVV